MIAPRRVSLPAFLPILLAIVGFTPSSHVSAQVGPGNQRAVPQQASPVGGPTTGDESGDEAGAAGSQDSDPRSLSDEQRDAIALWIEQLGSSEFAKRERAAVHLLEMGPAALPALEDAAAESTDAETRLRAGQIVKQLTEGDLQTRISDFLAGKRVDFAGWKAVEKQLGDSIAVRELFVELMQAHPSLVKSLDGTSPERTVALDDVMGKVHAKFRFGGSDPDRADVFALLLVSTDSNVMLNILYENLLLNLARRQIVMSILRDTQLAGPFNELFNKWMMRSSLTMRDEVLFQGMMLDMRNTLPLALRTLEETTQAEVIATCMQVIAKFGDENQTEVLSRFLSDDRIVSNRGFGQEAAKPQVRDIAMLALALLHELPLTELGMGHIRTHPAAGFEISDVAYTSKDPENQRAAALERIKKLLKEHSDEAS